MPINEWYFKFRNFIAKKFPPIYYYLNRHKSVVKFFISGCIAGVTNLIFLFIMHGLFLWGIILATSLAFVLAFLVSFSLQKFWTFRDHDHKKTPRQASLYLVTAFINLNLNILLMHILVNHYHVWYLLAQLGVDVLLGVFNFVVYRFIIFKTNKKNETYSQKSTVRAIS